LGASNSGRRGEAAAQEPRLQADEFDADQSRQVTLSACIELLNGGRGSLMNKLGHVSEFVGKSGLFIVSQVKRLRRCK